MAATVDANRKPPAVPAVIDKRRALASLADAVPSVQAAVTDAALAHAALAKRGTASAAAARKAAEEEAEEEGEVGGADNAANMAATRADAWKAYADALGNGRTDATGAATL